MKSSLLMLMPLLSLLVLPGCAFIPRDTALIRGEQHANPVRDGEAWVFANGRFTGNVLRGQPDGPGVFITPEGMRVDATFVQGMAEAGKVTDASGRLVHDGKFIDGQWPLPAAFALGEERFSGLVYGKAFAEGELVDARQQRYAFRSPLSAGKPHGLATLVDKAGNRQEVPFASGVRQGRGLLAPVKGSPVVQYWEDGRLVYIHPDPAVLATVARAGCKTGLGEWYLASGRCPGGVPAGKVTLFRPDGLARFIGQQTADGLLLGELYDQGLRQQITGSLRNGLIDGQVRVQVKDVTVYEGPARAGKYDGIGQCRHEGRLEACQHEAGIRNDATHRHRLALAAQAREAAAARERERQERLARQREQEAAEEREQRRQARLEEAETSRVIGQAILGVGQSVGQAYTDIEASRVRNQAVMDEYYEAQAREQRLAAEARAEQARRDREERIAQQNYDRNRAAASTQLSAALEESRVQSQRETGILAYQQAQAATAAARTSSAGLASGVTVAAAGTGSAAAQAATAATVKSSSGSASTGTAAAAAQARTDSATYVASPEGVVICELKAGGNFSCTTTLGSTINGGPTAGEGWRTPAEATAYVGGCRTPRRITWRSGYEVFGCGTGVTGMSNYIDVAAKLGVTVPGRNTYWCKPLEIACTRTSRP